jgi:hypothetical protein
MCADGNPPRRAAIPSNVTAVRVLAFARRSWRQGLQDHFGKILFQSPFMLTMVQPLATASSQAF